MEGKLNVFCVISTIIITLSHSIWRNSQQLHSRGVTEIFLAAFFSSD